MMCDSCCLGDKWHKAKAEEHIKIVRSFFVCSVFKKINIGIPCYVSFKA